MPVLGNAKHERFAQELAKGKSQIEAHELAGYAPNDGNAAKLAARREVQDRVKEITGRAAKRAEVTIEGLIAEAQEILDAAKSDKQHSAAVSALTAKAKLAGLWVEKTENKNRNVDADRLSDSELAAIAKGESGGSSAETPRDTSKLN